MHPIWYEMITFVFDFCFVFIFVNAGPEMNLFACILGL